MELNTISGCMCRQGISSIWISDVISVLGGSSGSELCPDFNLVPCNEKLAFQNWDSIYLSHYNTGFFLYGILWRILFSGKNVSLLYGYKLEELFLQVEYLVKNKRHFQIKMSEDEKLKIFIQFPMCIYNSWAKVGYKDCPMTMWKSQKPEFPT